MKTNKKSTWFNNEEGNISSLVVVLLLCMTLLATASMTLARTQLTMARFGRQTSNSYYLARSGAEKIVDSMNKEIATQLPRLMEEASKAAQEKLLKTEDKGGKIKDGVTYEVGEGKGANPYLGKYIGREYENEYEVKLREIMYDHIVEKFVKDPKDATNPSDYKAYSDTQENQPIKVTTKVYHRASGGNAEAIPEDVKKAIEKLAKEDEIGTSDKDAFVVEVVALAQKGTKTTLSKSRVIGSIALDQLVKDSEQLLEEYEWAVDESGMGVYPEALQSAVISFGDFIVQGKYKATINGDIHVKGTQRKPTIDEYRNGNFPEPDESGGITVSDGGALKVMGSALVVSNIQTANSYGKEDEDPEITITEDAIANTIAIHDSYYLGHPTNIEPWNQYTKNSKISIERNAYIDNDIRIDRYIDGGKVSVEGSVFGISDGDTGGKEVGDKTIVDPNRSSGIFSMGKDSVISMGRAFIAGQAFINFGDGKGYHRLYESAGEPFQDVYYLEGYQEEHGHSEEYIKDFEGIINTDKIKIADRNVSNPYGFAPSYVSEFGGKSYDVKSGVGFIVSQEEAKKIFYLGADYSLPETWKTDLAHKSDWSDMILGTDVKWGDVVVDPLSFYKGNNSYKKDYTPENFVYGDMLGYKGLQGYMLAKRGVFYDKFEEVSSPITRYVPAERKFEDLVDISVFEGTNKWSYNNPIHVISASETIDISKFESIPTAIVCTDKSAIITLTSSTATEFNGLIITPGKVKIVSNIGINGTIIAGNECGESTPSRENIQQGEWAGVQVSANDVTINYDRDMILKLRFIDKSLQRRLYDSVKITNYKSEVDTGLVDSEQKRINAIFGEKDRKIRLSPSSVISSEQGGLQFVMKSLRKL